MSRFGILDAVHRLTIAVQQFTVVQERLAAGEPLLVRHAAGELRRGLVDLAELSDLFPASDIAILWQALATVQGVEAALAAKEERAQGNNDDIDPERDRRQPRVLLGTRQDEVYGILVRLRARVVRRINDLR